MLWGEVSLRVMAAGDTLEQAQLNKLDALIAMAGISKGDHVLEVGCGWGSMAIRAVQVSKSEHVH